MEMMGKHSSEIIKDKGNLMAPRLLSMIQLAAASISPLVALFLRKTEIFSVRRKESSAEGVTNSIFPLLSGNAFRELRNVKLFPSVGMKKQPGAHLKVNFGQYPFIFDIDGMMAVSSTGYREQL